MAYLAPIHRPSSVRHAIKLNFLTPDDESLIVAKANRLEIYAHTPDGLVLQHTKAIYGKVTMLHKLKPATSETDHLFVGTDRYMYFTLSWDAAAKQLKTEKSYRDLAEKASRDSQTGDRCHIDPTRRFMTLEIYEGVVNVLPIAYAGKGKRKAADHEVGELGDTVPVRVPELFVRSSAFVHKRDTGNAAQDRPELALLYEDSQNKMQLKFRELEYNPSLNKDEPALAELEKGQDAFGDVEMGASHLIPLPGPTYGMLIIGETSIAYCDEWDHKITAQPLAEATIFVAWCAIDDQRFCLSDDYGQLYLLFIKRDQRDEYDGWQLDVLGETSRASTLVYLDGGKIFVGSHQGNSQLIQIQESGLEVLQTFANIAPILDFTVMDMGNRTSDAPVNEYSSGQARIVTGSGAYKDGSLRSVRSGVGLEDLGSIGEMAHATEIYSLKSSPGAEFMDTLVVSFVSHTRVFRFDSDGQVEEAEDFKGFDLAESTLYAGSLPDGRLVQVTSSAVLITDADGGMVTDTWRPPGEASITAVAASENHVLVSFKGAALAALDVSSSEVKVQAQHEFDSANQVSCIALSPAIPDACVVGFWQNAIVSFLDLRTLEPIRAEKVEEGGIAVPRSLLVASILEDSLPTLFVGMADGNVVTYSVDPSSHTLSARKSIILGTQQANFRALPRGNGLDNVFATCEHPSLIYGSEGRMVYSAVTAENASCVCPFDSEAYPNAIAIATETELKLALVDEERTTHVQTLPVNETVRRIAYSPDLKAFGLGTIKRTLTAGYENIESHFKLVDEVAFQELHTFALNQDELIESCIRAKLDDGSGETAERFVVGTAYLDDDAPDTAKGRILVFEVTEERRLKLVTEMALKGACRCLSMCQGRIVAALIKTVSCIHPLPTGWSLTPRPTNAQHSGCNLRVRIPNAQPALPRQKSQLPHRHRTN